MLSHDQFPEKVMDAKYVPGPLIGEGSHELVEELLLLLGSNLGHPGSHVERVVAEGLVARSEIESQGQGAVWLDTSAGGVESELSDGNTHAVYAKVTKTQDTGSVSEDSDVDLVWPVVEDLAKVAAVAP